MELQCIGTTISVAVNGTVIAVAEDGRYRSGRAFLAISGGDTAEARFDNLLVNEHR
jgi:hypothetical protein